MSQRRSTKKKKEKGTKDQSASNTTNNNRRSPKQIQPSTTTPATFTMLKNSPISSSTSKLLSANYNPTHNPKKDELVQNTSIKILEVETLLDKLNDHIDKHHRRSSQELQNFEQIHSELDKIQSHLIGDDNSSNRKNKPSKIDPFIIIAPIQDDNDNDNEHQEDEKDDEKSDMNDTPKSPSHTIKNDTLTRLEPFQSLVAKIQKEIDPNITSSDESDPKEDTLSVIDKNIKKQRKNSILVRESELNSIHDYVREHRNKMKEKTYQYEEKKKQLQNAKDRLIKAKARFKKRLNKSKERSRNRANSDHRKRRGMRTNIHTMATSADGHGASHSALSPKSTFHVINENSDVDNDHSPFSQVLSAANLSKFNHGISASSSDSYTSPPSSIRHMHPAQQSAPLHFSSPKGPKSPISRSQGHGPYGREVLRLHSKSTTNSSVQSFVSVISDQSFVDDFHSITAELETIDNIVNTQVKSPSMRSIFSDLASTPKSSGSDKKGGGNGKSTKEFNFGLKKDEKDDDHIKNNMSSLSESDSKETGKTMQSYCESIETSEAHSLQSDILQLQDIEQQISDI